MTGNISRRNILRGAGVAVLGASVAGWATGCSSVAAGGPASGAASNLLELAKTQGFIRVGIANEPPYTQVDADGTVNGCEPDVLRAVCKRLGIDDVQGIFTPYEWMFAGLIATRPGASGDQLKPHAMPRLRGIAAQPVDRRDTGASQQLAAQ